MFSENMLTQNTYTPYISFGSRSFYQQTTPNPAIIGGATAPQWLRKIRICRSTDCLSWNTLERLRPSSDTGWICSRQAGSGRRDFRA